MKIYLLNLTLTLSKRKTSSLCRHYMSVWQVTKINLIQFQAQASQLKLKHISQDFPKVFITTAWIEEE